MLVDLQEEVESEEEEAVTPWGMLAAIDLQDCVYERVAAAGCIRGFIREVVPAVGMRAHGPTHLERFGSGELEGWSAMQFIETSSITIHADEVGRRCFVDLFSCKDFDPEVVSAIARRWFGGTAHATVLRRGVADD